MPQAVMSVQQPLQQPSRTSPRTIPPERAEDGARFAVRRRKLGVPRWRVAMLAGFSCDVLVNVERGRSVLSAERRARLDLTLTTLELAAIPAQVEARASRGKR